MTYTYSVVVPIYEEEGNVAQLHKEILSAMKKLRGRKEIIYVNDGSGDNTLQNLRKLKGATIINLSRNYGQSTALDAGFKYATGEIIISLDGDLQNDPADIPRLVEKLEKSRLDVVAGWRKKRKDKSGIRILSTIGRLLRRIFIKDLVHDSGCTLRAYKKRAAKSLDLQGEMHRYIMALLRWKGFRVGEIEVNHRARKSGIAKYGMSKSIRGFLDLGYIWFISKYSQRPLHIFGYAGLLLFLAGTLSLVYSGYTKVALGLSLNRSGWFFAGFFLFLAGIMFFSFGIIIDLLQRIYHNSSQNEKRYYIRKIEQR